jgi:hypothetical protein
MQKLESWGKGIRLVVERAQNGPRGVRAQKPKRLQSSAAAASNFFALAGGQSQTAALH